MRKMRNEGDGDIAPRLSSDEAGSKTKGHRSRQQDDDDMDDTGLDRTLDNGR